MLIAEKSTCNGCELCASVCPNESINMQIDEEGFRYPYVNTKNCNQCNLCKNMCPVNNIDKIIIDTHNIEAFSGFYKNEDKLRKSASGGLSSAFAEKVISLGGKVYGVTYCDNYRNAKYIGISKFNEIDLLKGSKYIHANKGDIYKEVKSNVEQNQQVLFVGLPCEVAAVKSFLGREYDNLITCDLICHGPTSAKVADQYINHLEKLHKSKVKFFSVRHKEIGWTPPYIKAEFENGNIFLRQFYRTEYGVAFVNMIRRSCANCSFKGSNRVSDLTIGDFWGITPTDKGYNKNGVSIALVNTMNGKKFAGDLADDFVLNEADINLALLGNPRLNSSALCTNRENFSHSFVRGGLFYACKRGITFKSKFINYIRRLIPNKLFSYIKKILIILRIK